MFYFIGCN